MPRRQWVLSLPILLYVRLTAQPEMITPALQRVQRVLEPHRVDGAELRADPSRGGASSVQRLADRAAPG